MQTSPFVLAESTSPEFRERFFAALKCTATVAAARAVVAHTIELLEVAGLYRAIEDTVQRSMCDDGDVLAFLREQISELRRSTDAGRAEMRELKEYLESCRAAVAPLLNVCAAESLALPSEIAELEQRVRGFEHARERHYEALKAAGLDGAAITRAGLKPDGNDLREWQQAISVRRARLHRVQAFQRSGPLYDIALLEERDSSHG